VGGHLTLRLTIHEESLVRLGEQGMQLAYLPRAVLESAAEVVDVGLEQVHLTSGHLTPRLTLRGGRRWSPLGSH
jgi:hypothetical protein